MILNERRHYSNKEVEPKCSSNVKLTGALSSVLDASESSTVDQDPLALGLRQGDDSSDNDGEI